MQLREILLKKRKCRVFKHDYTKYVGECFGKLRVLEIVRTKNKLGHEDIRAKCFCECGNVVKPLAYDVIYKDTVSCGCHRIKIATKHGYYSIKKKGKRRLEINSYRAMLYRVKSEKPENYPYYLGKGIEVCERWKGKEGFLNFLKDMGKRPSLKYVLDRIDAEKNYEPSNCRWITWTENSRNRDYCKNSRLEKSCEYCNKKFVCERSRFKKARFCNRKCSRLHVVNKKNGVLYD